MLYGKVGYCHAMPCQYNITDGHLTLIQYYNMSHIRISLSLKGHSNIFISFVTDLGLRRLKTVGGIEIYLAVLPIQRSPDAFMGAPLSNSYWGRKKSMILVNPFRGSKKISRCGPKAFHLLMREAVKDRRMKKMRYRDKKTKMGSIKH